MAGEDLARRGGELVPHGGEELFVGELGMVVPGQQIVLEVLDASSARHRATPTRGGHTVRAWLQCSRCMRLARANELAPAVSQTPLYPLHGGTAPPCVTSMAGP